MPMDSKMCRTEMERIRSEAGYDVFNAHAREMLRERLQVQDRPTQKTYRWAEYKRLYERQRGKCGICNRDMVLIRGRVEMDHKNVNLLGEEYEAQSNRQVAHVLCNRRKSAKSIEQQAKETGKTMAELV